MGMVPLLKLAQDLAREQENGGELFLVSENRKYFFWVSTRTGTNRFGNKSDAHWEVL